MMAEFKKKPFIQLFYIILEDNKVMYTNHSAVLLII
jgi:hypothetical protein